MNPLDIQKLETTTSQKMDMIEMVFFADLNPSDLAKFSDQIYERFAQAILYLEQRELPFSLDNLKKYKNDIIKFDANAIASSKTDTKPEPSLTDKLMGNDTQGLSIEERVLKIEKTLTWIKWGVIGIIIYLVLFNRKSA